MRATATSVQCFSSGSLLTAPPPPALQELSGLQQAKQLLIQQKLEVQGQLEAERALLQTEQRAHQATRDSVGQREEQLLRQAAELQAQLVRPPCTGNKPLAIYLV